MAPTAVPVVSRRGDTPDSISLDIDPEMRRQMLKNEPMLQRALTAKLVGYYIQLALLVLVTFSALGCLAFGIKDPIWPMIITYVLGYLNNRGAIKAGKYARTVIANAAVQEAKAASTTTTVTPAAAPAPPNTVH